MYNAVAPIYYKDALGALIVYEITSEESFDKVRKWVQELNLHALKDIVVIIAANKSDLELNRTVNHQKAEEFATTHNIPHRLVSAKSGAGVNELFKELATLIHNRHLTQTKTPSKTRNIRLSLE